MVDDEPIDDNKQDLSVYDLAERLASGQPVSSAAEQEISAELARLRSEIDKLNDDINWFLDGPADDAREIIRIRAELHRIIANG